MGWGFCATGKVGSVKQSGEPVSFDLSRFGTNQGQCLHFPNQKGTVSLDKKAGDFGDSIPPVNLHQPTVLRRIEQGCRPAQDLAFAPLHVDLDQPGFSGQAGALVKGCIQRGGAFIDPGPRELLDDLDSAAGVFGPRQGDCQLGQIRGIGLESDHPDRSRVPRGGKMGEPVEIIAGVGSDIENKVGQRRRLRDPVVEHVFVESEDLPFGIRWIQKHPRSPKGASQDAQVLRRFLEEFDHESRLMTNPASLLGEVKGKCEGLQIVICAPFRLRAIFR